MSAINMSVIDMEHEPLLLVNQGDETTVAGKFIQLKTVIASLS